MAQSIVRAPDFFAITLRMAMSTDSVSYTEPVITDYVSCVMTVADEGVIVWQSASRDAVLFHTAVTAYLWSDHLLPFASPQQY